jgi:DNA repair exonuclease SbcCD nuclease subunit
MTFHDRSPLRLVHASDLHLGSGASVLGCGEGRACTCALKAVLAHAWFHRPHLVLLCGDLFDNVRVSPAFVDSVIAMLGRMPAPVVLLAGNHDLADDSSLLRRHEARLHAGDIVYLDGEADVLHGAVRVWGRATREHRPEFRPLAGAGDGERRSTAWFIVLGHGHYVDDEDLDTNYRSSPILPSDIAGSGADYVALGHWHHVAEVSAGGVPAWYSGTPVTPAGSGSMLLVDLEPAGTCRVTTLSVDAQLLAGPCTTAAAPASEKESR